MRNLFRQTGFRLFRGTGSATTLAVRICGYEQEKPLEVEIDTDKINMSLHNMVYIDQILIVINGGQINAGR